MATPSLIVLFGPQQSGKTSAADSLVTRARYTRMSFADPIYAMVAAMLQVTPEEVRRLPKDVPMPRLEGKTLRHALQTLGTEWGRSMLGEPIWLNTLVRRVKGLVSSGGKAVVDDCRFLDEYVAMEALGARFVRIRRASLSRPRDGHPSEMEWRSFEPHAEVPNSAASAPAWALCAAGAILTALEGAGA